MSSAALGELGHLDAAAELRLRSNIERLAEYTRANDDLKKAHHFLYDLRQPREGKPKFVVMGVNPGETPDDWRTASIPTEETSRFDFHAGSEPSKSAKRWAQCVHFFLDDAGYVLTELFFWSSKDSVEFGKRFGPIARSPHLSLCVKMNRALIDAHQPKAVILPGLANRELCRSLYGLVHEQTVKLEGVRLVEHYTDGQRPWIFTKHWTAAFGFSNTQQEAVLEHIRAA